MARALSWLSLLWMTVEGAAGIASGIAVGSVALVGWALSSAVEGLASGIVIWRFTGQRTHSEDSEARAQKFVAVSFFLLAPYVAAGSIRELLIRGETRPNLLAIVLLCSSAVLMPVLGVAKHRLGLRLSSGATSGEGTQNLLCAYLAVAVLIGLVVEHWFGWWWFDPIAGLAVAAVAVREGREAWRGDECCSPVLGFETATTTCSCSDQTCE